MILQGRARERRAVKWAVSVRFPRSLPLLRLSLKIKTKRFSCLLPRFICFSVLSLPSFPIPQFRNGGGQAQYLTMVNLSPFPTSSSSFLFQERDGHPERVLDFSRFSWRASFASQMHVSCVASQEKLKKRVIYSTIDAPDPGAASGERAARCFRICVWGDLRDVKASIAATLRG